MLFSCRCVCYHSRCSAPILGWALEHFSSTTGEVTVMENQASTDTVPQTYFYYSLNSLFCWSSSSALQGDMRLFFSWTMSSNKLVQASLSTLVQWSICNAGVLTLCPLFHMSVPNTFPFTLAVSFCHWGLPHGVDHVPQWEQIILQLLSPFFFFFGKKKRNAQKRAVNIAEYRCFTQVSVCASHVWQPPPPPYCQQIHIRIQPSSSRHVMGQ